MPNTVVVDCTASDAPAAAYESWMKRGIHVITPNKKMGSGPLDRYKRARALTRKQYTHWYYEVSTTSDCERPRKGGNRTTKQRFQSGVHENPFLRTCS